jgi:phosphoglycolate phosphatase-like HAD superfamily hydrolase
MNPSCGRHPAQVEVGTVDPMPKPLIALDADGVLLDFHLGYAGAWHRAFGEPPRERDPLAYWPMDRWEVDRLDETRRAHFRRHFDETFWTTVPAMDGAVDACHRLHDAGFDLVCVSALELEFESARLRNLRDLGFPIERVVATGNAPGRRSPKADAIAALKPRAFVDDYLPYLRGVPAKVHKALILRAPNGSPNTGEEMALVQSIHDDLAGFADHWLTR